MYNFKQKWFPHKTKMDIKNIKLTSKLVAALHTSRLILYMYYKYTKIKKNCSFT